MAMNTTEEEAKRMQVEAVLIFAVKKMIPLNPDLAACLTFLLSTFEKGDERDLTEWMAFYAKAQFDNNYGKGAADKIVDILEKERPKNLKEFKEIVHRYMP